MARYIELDALIREIKKRKQQYEEWKNSCKGIEALSASVAIQEDINILYLLNSLKVKEMDLDKEYKDFVDEDPVYNKLINDIVGKAIAKHFFELGLKAQKGEEV